MPRDILTDLNRKPFRFSPYFEGGRHDVPSSNEVIKIGGEIAGRDPHAAPGQKNEQIATACNIAEKQTPKWVH